jgi:outer membrane protein
MKKLIFILAIMMAGALGCSAQKFALVDMEYILKNYPQYEMANEQLNQLSQRWQREVETKAAESEQLYKNFQAESVFLTDDQKKTREAEIVASEKAATELKYKYFGPEGELYKKRQTLMQPIQDEIYNAIKKLAEEKGYQCIFDRASSANIIFASPRIDVSNEVLAKLGYSK